MDISKVVNKLQAKDIDEAELDFLYGLLQQNFAVPKTINVGEAAEILGISTQMVRRYCAEGRIAAEQAIKGSGKWRIDTKQFIQAQGFEHFVSKCLHMKEASMNLTMIMLEIIEDKEEQNRNNEGQV